MQNIFKSNKRKNVYVNFGFPFVWEIISDNSTVEIVLNIYHLIAQIKTIQY